MEVAWKTKDESARLYLGDSRELLRDMEAASVQCCVTSPPYWGLRDYGTAQWEGGDAACDHLGRSQTSGASTLGEWKSGGGQEYKEQAGGMPFRDTCGKCGAVRIDKQLGLEKTPEEYVANMVAVFREVRRVLRDDGTLWLNLGDSYARDAAKGQHKPGDSGKQNYIIERGGGRAASGFDFTSKTQGSSDGAVGRGDRAAMRAGANGLKPKDLVGIPWMVAFALRADGWYLRQDIIWHKPNPMPESVRDRCTKAHEYIFLLSKSERYHYDADAIKEPAVGEAGNRREFRGGGSYTGGNSFQNSNEKPNATPGNDGVVVDRNRRSVWTVATKPYKEAHFATFPPDLIEPCILAGCPEGGTVLDPFNGSGTTGAVAVKHGRRYAGLELNPAYLKMAAKRIRQAIREHGTPLFVATGTQA